MDGNMVNVFLVLTLTTYYYNVCFKYSIIYVWKIDTGICVGSEISIV